MITIKSMHPARFAVFLAALSFSSLALAAHCSDMTAVDIHLDPQIKNGGSN